MRITVRKICRFCVNILIILVLITAAYWLCNRESRLRTLEDADIIYISENYIDTVGRRNEKTTSNYFIGKDGRVYILKNKELTEIKELYGARKIISTYDETIILKEDGTLWNYDKDNKRISIIEGMGKCKDIINCADCYGVLNENGEVWLSRAILDKKDDNPDKAEGSCMKIDFPVKMKSISCSNTRYYDDDVIERVGICALDEEDCMWGYNKYDFPYISENGVIKMKNFDNIDRLSARWNGLFVSDGRAYKFEMEDFFFALSEEDFNEKFKKENYIIKEIQDKKITDVMARNYKEGYMKTEEGEIYKVEYEYSNVEEADYINSGAEIFFTAYGIITIDNDGKIRLHRDEPILFELGGPASLQVRCDEIFPWYDLI